VSESHELRTRPHGFMVPVLPELPKARRYSAKSTPCPACHAAAGDACTGPQVCAARMHAAVDAMRAGKLQELPEGTEVTVEPCAECTSGRYKTADGRPKACPNPLHRCSKSAGPGQCVRPVTKPGVTRFCHAHTPPQQRWADRSVSRA
jgi:hypothetical protein